MCNVKLLTNHADGHISHDDPLELKPEECAAVSLLQFNRLGEPFHLDSRLEVTTNLLPKDFVSFHTVREVLEWVRSADGQTFLSQADQIQNKQPLEALADELFDK